MDKGGPRINPCLVLLNVLLGLAGVGFVGVGLWMAGHHSTNCVHFLQAFSIGAGLFMLALAMAGLVGSFRRVTWLLYLNFGVMLALLLVVLATSVFVLLVTRHGIQAYVAEEPGHPSPHLSNWLVQRVNDRIRSCTQNGQICQFVDYTYTQSSPYYHPTLSSLQVGCCEPPSGCNTNNSTMVALQADCEAWREVGAQGFCLHCSSCRAAVAENIRQVWHQVAIFKIITLLVLIPAYFITCCSFKHEDDEKDKCTSCQEYLNCCYSCLP